jgi:hypothetical protein
MDFEDRVAMHVKVKLCTSLSQLLYIISSSGVSGSKGEYPPHPPPPSHACFSIKMKMDLGI